MANSVHSHNERRAFRSVCPNRLLLQLMSSGLRKSSQHYDVHYLCRQGLVKIWGELLRCSLDCFCCNSKRTRKSFLKKQFVFLTLKFWLLKRGQRYVQDIGLIKESFVIKFYLFEQFSKSKFLPVLFVLRKIPNLSLSSLKELKFKLKYDITVHALHSTRNLVTCLSSLTRSETEDACHL